jgi:transcriptional regulator with XRE-family HTH domain
MGRMGKRKADPQRRFGDRLRQLRHAAGLSQEQLATKAGLDRTYVSSCERGERNVSLSTICKLAEALGVSPHELLTGLAEHGEQEGRAGPRR